MRNNSLLVLGAFLCAFLLRSPSEAGDTNCGGQPCEEVVCSRSDVILCSDWNNLNTDGWSWSPTGSPNPPQVAGVGLNGTGGNHFRIQANTEGAVFGENYQNFSGVGTGPVHFRFYVKFQPGYVFPPYPGKINFGLQKMMYLESNVSGQPFWRIMLGIRQAARSGFPSQPNTIGMFNFDYTGHIIAPNPGTNPADIPVFIEGDRWYAVEFMVHWISRTNNTVKVWVNDTLTMTRTNFDDGVWNSNHRITNVFDSSHYGGESGSGPGETLNLFKDNYVVARSYIGPIGGGSSPNPPTSLRISRLMRKLWGVLWVGAAAWHRPAQNAANGW